MSCGAPKRFDPRRKHTVSSFTPVCARPGAPLSPAATARVDAALCANITARPNGSACLVDLPSRNTRPTSRRTHQPRLSNLREVIRSTTPLVLRQVGMASTLSRANDSEPGTPLACLCRDADRTKAVSRLADHGFRKCESLRSAEARIAPTHRPDLSPQVAAWLAWSIFLPARSDCCCLSLVRRRPA